MPKDSKFGLVAMALLLTAVAAVVALRGEGGSVAEPEAAVVGADSAGRRAAAGIADADAGSAVPAPADGTDSGSANAERLAATATGRADVEVVDEQGRAVVGAQVRLCDRFAADELSDARVLTAKSGADGHALFAAVPLQVWFASAGSSELMFSWGLQPGGRPMAMGVGAAMHCTVRLGEPRIAGVRVRGGDVVHCRFATSAQFVEPDDDGSGALPALQRWLQTKWPGAHFCIVLRAPAPATRSPEPDEDTATVFVADRRPWKGAIAPVPLAEFAGPIEIDAAGLTRSDDFGSVDVRVRDFTGELIRGLTLSLTDLPAFAVGTIALPNGAAWIVPRGDYRLQLAREPFLRALLPEQLFIRRGSQCALACDGVLLTRCVLTIDAPDDVEQVRFEHDAMPVPVDFDTGRRATVTCWVPEGTLRATFRGRLRGVGLESAGPRNPFASRAALGHCAPIGIGGGTLAAPQRVTIAVSRRR